MNLQIGKLTFTPALEHRELLGIPVAEALSKLAGADQIGVVEIDPTVSDTAAFCEKYGITMAQCANCVILEARQGEERSYVASMILGTTRADVNGLVRKTIDIKKVSFAPMETAVSLTNMEFGAITSVGLPATWTILVDKAVADSEYVVIGSGIRKSKLAIPGKVFASLPNVKILEGLGMRKAI